MAPLGGAESGSVSLTVVSDMDAGRARRAARVMAERHGFGVADAEAVAIAASELAMNLVRYARGGQMTLVPLADAAGSRKGVRLESSDLGPGIGDMDRAMRDGFSTGGGMGAGLGGVRRLMDEFEIASSSEGTVVVAVKWVAQR